MKSEKRSMVERVWPIGIAVVFAADTAGMRRLKMRSAIPGIRIIFLHSGN